MHRSFKVSALVAGVAISAWAITGNAGVVSPCNMHATAAAGVFFACPAGDGDMLSASGLTIQVEVRDNTDTPVPGILPSDIWFVGCNDLLSLCGGSGAINASAPTDQNGLTTITGRLAGGGCDLGGVRVVVQGVLVGSGVCGQPCVPIKVKSCDINGNLVTNLVDFSLFGAGYPSPPKAYNECIDYTSPYGSVNLSDFAKYGSHNNHSC